MFEVLVTLAIKPDCREACDKEMKLQATNSLEKESGCSVFDVWVNAADESKVQLYEVYSSAEAFQHHLQTEHFKAFDAKVASMIADKSVTTFDQKL